MLTVILHHVKTAYDIVRGCTEYLPVTFKDIKYTVMGTPQKQPALAVLRDDKALFVYKIIGLFLKLCYNRS